MKKDGVRGSVQAKVLPFDAEYFRLEERVAGGSLQSGVAVWWRWPC